MNTRLVIGKIEPQAYEAMMVMEKYLSESSLEPALAEMIRFRASQINGCAYCIEMHSEAAIKQGESANKLFAISAWRESPLFSDKEKAAFAMTDEITNISAGGLSDETFNEAKNHFSENEIAQMTMLIGQINTWNRIAISTHMFHEK